MQRGNKTCPFCKIADKLFEKELAQAFYDKNPVGKGHVLITPKRHEANYFNLTKHEREAMHELLELSKKALDTDYAPQKYHIGVNIGEVAGQTIFHCHIHLIPRYFGDVADPTGGVRGVIPKHQNYK